MSADESVRKTFLDEATSNRATKVTSNEEPADKPEAEMTDVKEEGGIADETSHVFTKLEKGIDHISGQAEILYEAVIDTAVTKIVGSFTWANSSTLDTTILLTFGEIYSDSGTINLVWVNWLYFVFIVVILILSAYKFRYYMNYEIGSTKKKLGVQGKEPVLFIEKEIDDFKKAFSKLFLDTLSVVCALALRAATTTSFAEIVNVEYVDGYFQNDTSGLLGITLIYAVVVTGIICYFSFKTGPTKKNEKSDDASTEKESDKSSRPLQDVAQTVSGLIIAFAWRGYFVVFIISIVGEVGSDVTGFWVYAIIITILATAFLSLLDLWSCCVPNFESVPFRKKSSEREYLGGVLEGALQFAVGLAWVDAFKASFRTMSTDDEMAAAWAYCAIMIVVMVLSTIYFKKCLFSISADVGGILEFIDDNIDAIDFYDDWERNEGARRPFPIYLRDNFIELSMYAISLAAGFSLSPAIQATISYFLEKDSDADTVLGSWLAVIGVFSVSALITLYLGRLMKKARTARKLAVAFIEDDIL